MFTGVSPPRPNNTQTVYTSSPPAEPRSLPSPTRRSVPEETAASPTLSAREPAYVRHRDRAPSNPVSPTASSDQSHAIPPPPPPTSETLSATSENNSMAPPPTISLRGTSPAQSLTSLDSSFRTPSEFPLPPPAPFYQHPSASGSGSLTSGGVRTNNAAAFKRQLRKPSTPPTDGPPADVSPLNISKRGLPGSPRPSPQFGPSDGGMQRLSSAPGPYGSGFEGQQHRSVSASGRPISVAPGGDQGEEDEYDYISAYVDNGPTSPDTHRGP